VRVDGEEVGAIGSGLVVLVGVAEGDGPAEAAWLAEYVAAARPEIAEPLVRSVAERLRTGGLEVAEGRFGAMMDLELVNDGPVTILLDSEKRF
jgi:D-tyrosyl-tRNA(Tyr) deacylase